MAEKVEKITFQSEGPNSGTWRMLIENEDGTIKNIVEGVVLQNAYDGTYKVMYDGKVETVMMTGLHGIREKNPGITIDKGYKPLPESFSVSSSDKVVPDVSKPEDNNGNNSNDDDEIPDDPDPNEE